MKTLFISGDPAILDPTTASAVRMRAYADALGSLSILIRIPKGQPTMRTDGPLTVYGVPGGKLDGARALADKAHALILTEGIEVVSAQDPFEHGWAAERAVRGTNAKLHLQVHTDFLSPWFVRGGVLNSPQLPVPLLNRIRRTLADRLLLKAHGIRVVSERIRLSLMARYGNRIVPPVVIPLTPPTDSGPLVPLPHSSFNFVFMTVSRLAPEKRIEDLEKEV